MLAARMYNRDDLRLENVCVPEISEGEILLKVKAAAICGTDVRMLSSGANGISPENPRILGHELAGVIEKIGSKVKGYHIGQRVAVAPNMGCGICEQCIKGDSHLCPTYSALGINLDGGFAEYCVIPENAVRSGNVCVLADNVSFAEGAINEPLSCVCNGFERADIHPGDTVLVIGAGPIGIMHCALALMAGGRVFLNDLSADRLDEAKKLYPKINLIYDNLKDEIMKQTGGCGADAIITACPSPAVQALAPELAAIGGRVIFFGGIPASAGNVPINTNLVHYRQLILSGTTRASLLQYQKTLRFISTGVLDVSPMISTQLPLCEIEKGFELAKNAIGLKNIITMD